MHKSSLYASPHTDCGCDAQVGGWSARVLHGGRLRVEEEADEEEEAEDEAQKQSASAIFRYQGCGSSSFVG